MKLLASFVGAAMCCSASGAYACSVVVPRDHDGSAKQRENVREAIDSASVIVDGEVIRPMTRQQSALVRVHRIHKGVVADVVEIEERDSCSIRLARKGERMRMLLSGGPETYALYRDQSEAALEDKLLGSDRGEAWPYFAGDEPEPVMK